MNRGGGGTRQLRKPMFQLCTTMYFDTRIDNNYIFLKYQFLYQNDLKVCSCESVETLFAPLNKKGVNFLYRTNVLRFTLLLAEKTFLERFVFAKLQKKSFRKPLVLKNGFQDTRFKSIRYHNTCLRKKSLKTQI